MEVNHWKYALGKGIISGQCSSLEPCFKATMKWVTCSTASFCHNINHKLYEPFPPPLNCIYRYFGHSEKKLTNAHRPTSSVDRVSWSGSGMSFGMEHRRKLHWRTRMFKDEFGEAGERDGLVYGRSMWKAAGKVGMSWAHVEVIWIVTLPGQKVNNE